ncbi:TPA: hypothetical protein DDZ10_02175 [Candidatus Uhrbacteria bacterium]|uniref:Segregation and condensation protein A n=1 Tax=Candidatus Uhrbacteria bacterium GW2011_GWC2_53_7 TaxID=1618986 RepID=A0A0G1Y0M1_9BACT|nr:MAG: Segregation and condensation protein A [Parcubacteria group bacterium GW2011_GWA2_53_21]KKW36993.1 MAG: Segregation and condensation protein A [Candidatus Uhrbacteria bacterium GW2011_GWC2_53_7]OGL72151.1 MAG: hypothetical protein A3D69_01250 [Candidatus Uhrbacteria bacterium RIFCSPHIGHO2_02_FULL_54_11]HBL39456.1 hypothetical protein [Candidatus Uhrbacteria bacterium]
MSAKSNPTVYNIETEAFSGPLQLLLELIEKEELAITDVSLGAVTGSYLKHFEGGEVSSEHLADFLVVATWLLYLKSRELLPDIKAEEEEGAEGLAGQLRLYQIFMEAAKGIEEGYRMAASVHGRPKAVLPPPPAPVWPEGLVPSSLESAFQGLLNILRPFLALRETSMERVRSVGERMEELRAMIGTRARLAWRDLTAGAKSKMEVVVSFLALLELVKQRAVQTKQARAFQDILIDRL